jgi:hypothetical protein
MKRYFLRVTFTVLALFLMVAGSMNLRHANAQGLCDQLGCHSGDKKCAEIGTNPPITCFDE